MKRSSCLFLLFPCLLGAQIKRSPEITAAELRGHVQYLASDALKGRKAGSVGADKAAGYIANEFKLDKLAPMGDHGTYFQRFEFVAGVQLGTANTFVARENGTTVDLRLDEQYRPLGFSSNGTFTGEVVFAGYGISAPENNYDDYHGVDVKDKAVIVLRYAPTTDSVRNQLNQFASLRYKALKAKELGAKVLIVVTGPLDSDNDDLIKLSYDQSTGNAGIPAVTVTRAEVDGMLRNTGTTIKELQEAIARSKHPQTMAIKDLKIELQTDVVEIQNRSANVIGFLEGHDPALQNEVVVIGAHYDHLGYGGEGSGSLKPDTVAIHYGADDNASGTSGLLELAQSFASRRTELKRSLLFIAFTGEEEGLLGSDFYVKNPTVPLVRTVAMINMDMIGRLNNGKLIVYGTGTSLEFDSLVTRHNADSSFVLSLVKDGFGPSDQSSFYANRIPVYFFFTDLHADYHRPSDTWDKLNYGGMEKVVRFIEDVTFDVDQESTRPKYIAVAMPKASGSGSPAYRVYMGTIPDFGEQVEGMKLSGVREGSPAAKAGLQAGDIIVRFGTTDIKNLYDFAFALGEHKPGDDVDVVIKRGTELLTKTVKLEKRN